MVTGFYVPVKCGSPPVAKRPGRLPDSHLRFTTPLKLLSFLKMREVFSHLDRIYYRFYEVLHPFDVILEYFAPLMDSENITPAFFQGSRFTFREHVSIRRCLLLCTGYVLDGELAT